MAGVKGDNNITGTERIPKVDQERVRKKIPVAQIVDRLMKSIDGTVEMSNIQMRAAEVLLKKALPDLQSIEHTGEQQTGLSELLALASKQAAALESQAKQRDSADSSHAQGQDRKISKDEYQPQGKPN